MSFLVYAWVYSVLSWCQKNRALTWVGVMVLTSSEASCFNKVVLPALSRPRRTIRNSNSVVPFSFSMTENKPWRWWGHRFHKGSSLGHYVAIVISFYLQALFCKSILFQIMFHEICAKVLHIKIKWTITVKLRKRLLNVTTCFENCQPL